jgi:hypothetical protein
MSLQGSCGPQLGKDHGQSVNRQHWATKRPTRGYVTEYEHLRSKGKRTPHPVALQNASAATREAPTRQNLFVLSRTGQPSFTSIRCLRPIAVFGLGNLIAQRVSTNMRSQPAPAPRQTLRRPEPRSASPGHRVRLRLRFLRLWTTLASVAWFWQTVRSLSLPGFGEGGVRDSAEHRTLGDGRAAAGKWRPWCAFSGCLRLWPPGCRTSG